MQTTLEIEWKEKAKVEDVTSFLGIWCYRQARIKE